MLKDCPSLVEIYSSTGQRLRVVSLNLKDCMSLTSLPRCLCMLESLEILVLSDCSKLGGLLEDLGKLERLRVLLADQTAIRRLPFSVNFLKNLRLLSLRGCNGASLRTVSHSFFWTWISRRISNSITFILPNFLLGLHSLRRLIFLSVICQTKPFLLILGA